MISIYQATSEQASKLLRIDQLPLGDLDIMQQYLDRSTHIWVGFDDEVLLGAYGLVPRTLLSDCAYLWLYLTDRSNSVTFARHSKRAVAHMLTHFSTIVGHCVVGSEQSIRWLRWLGAQFGEPKGNLVQFEIKATNG